MQNEIQWRTTQEAMKMTGLSHTAIMHLLGAGTLNGTSLDNHVLITSTSLARLQRSMHAAKMEGGRQ